MNGENKSKLTTLSKKYFDMLGTSARTEIAYEAGFKEAFDIIDKNLANEIKRIEIYPHCGERIMTLKVYKSKIKEILVDMEKSYE